MVSTAPYISELEEDMPSGFTWTPEFSRRARGVPVYAALRFLGRDGVTDLIERCCRHAQRMAERLEQADGFTVLNDVVLNQVIARVGDDDDLTNATLARVQRDGTCYVSGSTFRGQAVIRCSVVGWQTTEADIDRSADAIIAATLGAGSGSGETT
jgi:glutamate/tyrosine decarboxylase-like PLP-dependent enzyme